MDESTNDLGLSEEDVANMKTIMDDLIDNIAMYNSLDQPTEKAFAALKSVLDFATFVVDGVIYSNGLDLCADHDHDDDDDDE